MDTSRLIFPVVLEIRQDGSGRTINGPIPLRTDRDPCGPRPRPQRAV